MQELLNLIEQYGLLIVLINVFVEQMGLPIPAYPTMLIAGAVTSTQNSSFALLLITAVSGALLADFFWFYAGRRFGKRCLSKLCKLSLSADSCVKQTESVFLRIGPSSLLFCKFIPGFASISSALAGAVGTTSLVFILFDGLGAAIWAGSAIVLGATFSSAIEQLLAVLIQLGKWGVIIVALAFGLFVAKKWWERHQFIRALRMARISVTTLYELIGSGANPLIIDTRPTKLIDNGWIPGARFITVEQVDSVIKEIDIEQHIVLYCSCPNEVTAAKLAKAFISKGYLNVHPLAGEVQCLD